MKNSLEVIIAILILSILWTFLNPMDLFMPDSTNTMLTLALIITFLVFVALIWREKASDERDLLHIQKSSRISYFIGTTILVIGVVIQATRHQIDPWLLYSLSAIVITKVISRIFHRYRN